MSLPIRYPLSATVMMAGVFLLSACDGESRPFLESVEIAELNVTALQITPPDNTQESIFINTGESLQVGVSGTAAAGTSVVISETGRSFRSSNPAVLSVTDSGVVTGGEPGSAEISVSIGGLVSDRLTITVSNSALASINSIEGDQALELCLPGEYFAVGLFEDNSTRTLSEVSFSLVEGSEATLDSDGSVVSVNASGGTGVTLTAQVGELAQTRELDVLQNLDSIVITPADPEVEEDETIALTAAGTYLSTEADGVSREEDITSSVQWSISSGTDNASVSNSEDDSGLLSGIEEGAATVQATCGVAVTTQQSVTVIETTIDDSDELSFNTTRSDGTLVVDIEDDPFELEVSRGSEFDEDNVESDDDLFFTVNFLGGVTAIDLEALQDDSEVIGLVANGEAEITAILVDSDGDEIASGSITVRVSQ